MVNYSESIIYKLYCNDLNVPNEITFENIITHTPYKKGKVYTVLSIESDHFVINDQILLKTYERIAWVPCVNHESILEMKVEPIEMKPVPIEVKVEPKKIKKSLPTAVKDCIWNYYIGQHINIHKCFCCKKNMIKIDDFHAGHVVAEAQGGGDNIDNLRPICCRCNLSMGNQYTIDEWNVFGKLENYVDPSARTLNVYNKNEKIEPPPVTYFS